MPAEFLYPTISKAIISSSGIRLDRSFYFVKDGVRHDLKEGPLPKSTNELERRLEDETSSWNHRSDPVHAIFTVSIKYPNEFYGTYGIAASKTKLGLGIEWKAKDSKVRGYQFLGYIQESETPIKLDSIDTTIKDLTSDVYVRLVIFVSEPGVLKKDEFFGNEKGLVLGKIDAFHICVEGKGSVFPLDTIEDQNGPLWSVFVEFDDAYSDPFDDEYIYVAFNKLNPAYKYIDFESKEYNEPFMKQTFAAALATLLLEIRSRYPDEVFNLEKKSEPGSIHTAIKYFADVKKIDVNGSPAELAKTVTAFIEKEL